MFPKYIWLVILIICGIAFIPICFIPDLAEGDSLWIIFDLLVIAMYIIRIKEYLKKTGLIKFFKKEKRKIEEENLEICETCEGDCSWMHPHWRFRTICPVCDGAGVIKK